MQQRRLREGFSHYDIINFGRPSQLPINKVEGLGKVFDYQRATFHNYQTSFQERLAADPTTFRRSQGELSKRMGAIKQNKAIARRYC